MKHLLYLLLACILLSSCNASRRAARKAPTSTSYDLPRLAVGDTAHIRVVTPNPPKQADKPTIAADGSTVVLPKKIKNGSVSVNIGSGSSTSSTAAKKAAAAVGEGATTTSIGKVKAPTAVGDSATATELKVKDGAGAVGKDNNVKNEPPEKKSPWLTIIVVGLILFGIWKFLANRMWYKLLPWVPSIKKQWWVAGVFVAIVVGLIYWFS